MFAVAILGLCIALAACAGPSATSPGGRASSAAVGDPLDGTAWALVTMGDQPVPASSTATIAFAAGTASGASGCNTFTGAGKIDGPSIKIGPLVSTRMACPGAVMAFEQVYVIALEGVATWAVPQDAAMGTQLTPSGTGPRLVFGKPAGE